MERASRVLLEKQLKFINLLLKYRQVSKLLSSFLTPFESFVETDSRIRPSFHNTVCVSGRLSCSSPNIEQLPQNNDIANIRNLFVAEEGNVFIVADYSGQEVRIMAEESGDSAMKDIAANGDLHQETANAIGISRKEAKTVVFGTAYGKGAYGFAKDFNCSEKEAQIFIDKFLNRFPSLKRRIERCKEQVYKHGYVTNMSGRKRRFPDFHKKNKWGKGRCYRQAFNFLIQSFGADVVKAAAIQCIKDSKLRIVNIVHDELVFECPKYYVKEGIKYIETCMINVLPMSIPWEVSITQAERYGEAKE